MITKRKSPTDGGNHQVGALSKGTEQAPFNPKTTTTPHKIKSIMIESLLTMAAVPAVLLLAPLVILAVARLFGGSTS